uniref:Uncharacterized protein n=1 Tax=Solanum tuberosum TaxID=4113 RepID=M1DUI6_SOLTU
MIDLQINMMYDASLGLSKFHKWVVRRSYLVPDTGGSDRYPVNLDESNIIIEVFFPTTTSVHFDFWEGECSANLGGDDGIGHYDTAGCRDWGLNCSSKADLLSQDCRGNTYYVRSSSREQIDRMGLTLDYYPPAVKDGHKVATRSKEIQEESQKWMVSLIGYVVRGNPTSSINLGVRG